jgi:hypothetical protein
MISSLVASADLSHVKAFLTGSDISRKTSFHLIHYLVDEKEFKKVGIDFATVYIAKLWMEKQEVKCRDDLVMFVKSSEGLGTAGALRGHLHEGYAHHILSLGGEFQIRDLTSHVVSTLVLPRSSDISGLRWKRVDKLHNLPIGLYAYPAIKNFGAIDSLIILPKNNSLKTSTAICLFQMTVSDSHPIAGQSLQDTLAVLAKNQNCLGAKTVYLFWVLPQDRFNAFSVQGFKDASMNNDLTRIPSLVKNVHQCALLLKYSQHN